jgi:MscS family membrane protein
MELCQYRRTKLIIRVEYGTPTEKIKKFIEGIKKIILENEHTRKDFFQVALNEFDESNLNIVMYLFLNVTDWPTQLVQREEIFLEILQLAEIEDIKIGSPAGMLDIKSMSKNTNTKLPRD